MLTDRCDVEEVGSRADAVELLVDVGGIDVAVVGMRAAINGSRETLSGVEALRAMRKASPGLGIVALGEASERHWQTEAFSAGAGAYLTKGAAREQLLAAVDAVLDQERFSDPAVPSKGRLTRRQRQILQLLAEGESTTVAARTLGLGEETVKTHTRNILSRLEVRNRTNAVAVALREGLIE